MTGPEVQVPQQPMMPQQPSEREMVMNYLFESCERKTQQLNMFQQKLVELGAAMADKDKTIKMLNDEIQAKDAEIAKLKAPTPKQPEPVNLPSDVPLTANPEKGGLSTKSGLA